MEAFERYCAIGAAVIGGKKGHNAKNKEKEILENLGEWVKKWARYPNRQDLIDYVKTSPVFVNGLRQRIINHKFPKSITEDGRYREIYYKIFDNYLQEDGNDTWTNYLDGDEWEEIFQYFYDNNRHLFIVP